MNIINNIKKTIAVTLLGGGMPLFIIFICLAILLTSVSVSSDDAYAEREGMQTIEQIGRASCRERVFVHV